MRGLCSREDNPILTDLRVRAVKAMKEETMFKNIKIRGPLMASAAALAISIFLTATPVRADETAAIDPASYAGNDIGDVTRARGNIAGLFQKLPRTLSEGSNVRFMDTIVTGADSRAEMVLIDDSVVTVGDNTELTIDEMVFEPGKRSVGLLTLTKGVFRMVSGNVNKVVGGKLTLRTPIATIGVRGTDFWGLQEKNKLTMALIDNGVIEITGADGVTITLDTPLQAVVIERGQPTPTTPINLTVEQLNEAAKTVQF